MWSFVPLLMWPCFDAESLCGERGGEKVMEWRTLRGIVETSCFAVIFVPERVVTVTEFGDCWIEETGELKSVSPWNSDRIHCASLVVPHFNLKLHVEANNAATSYPGRLHHLNASYREILSTSLQPIDAKNAPINLISSSGSFPLISASLSATDIFSSAFVALDSLVPS